MLHTLHDRYTLWCSYLPIIPTAVALALQKAWSLVPPVCVLGCDMQIKLAQTSHVLSHVLSLAGQEWRAPS